MEGGKFIKATEFENDGLDLTVVSFEVVKSDNPTFGANEKDGENSLFDQEKLKEGETFRYSFTGLDAEGFVSKRVVESKSIALFIAFSECNPSAGERVNISKTGKLQTTRYVVRLLEDE